MLYLSTLTELVGCLLMLVARRILMREASMASLSGRHQMGEEAVQKEPQVEEGELSSMGSS